MINITNLIIWFAVGFIIVYFIRTFHIKRVIKKRTDIHSQENSFTFKKAYKKSILFFPFYFLPIWLLCSYFYFSNTLHKDVVLEGIIVAVLWVSLLIVFDFFIWLQTKEKQKMSWKEIYLKSQPWTSLMYYTTMISPIIVALIIYKK